MKNLNKIKLKQNKTMDIHFNLNINKDTNINNNFIFEDKIDKYPIQKFNKFKSEFKKKFNLNSTNISKINTTEGENYNYSNKLIGKILNINKKELIELGCKYNNKIIKDFISKILLIKSNLLYEEELKELFLDISKQRKKINDETKIDLTIAKFEGFLYHFRKNNIELLCIREKNIGRKNYQQLLEFKIKGYGNKFAKHLPIKKLNDYLFDEEKEKIMQLNLKMWRRHGI